MAQGDGIRLGVAAAVAAGFAAVYVRKKADASRKKQLTKLRFDLTPADIIAETSAILELWGQVEDEIAMAESTTYEETAARIAQLELELSPRISSVSFLRYVGKNKEIRQAATTAHEAITTYGLKSGLRYDVYRVIKALEMSPRGMRLEGEKKRFVQVLVREYERNGVHLDNDAKEKLIELKQRISALSIAFANNLNEDTTQVICTKDELDGVSDDILKAMKMDENGNYIVTMKYPIVFPILKTCSVAETRRRVEAAFDGRCLPVNVAIVEEMVQLRHEVANLLGFTSHAAFIADIRMAKFPDSIRCFLKDLNRKLSSLTIRERDALLSLKKEECQRRNESFDNQIQIWDYRYYINQFERINCTVDHSIIQEYFPLDHVTEELLKIYQQILSLKFTEIDSPHVWHRDVRMFAVHDTRSGRHNGKLVGHFYLDLLTREGKYSHAACHGLQASCLDTELKRQLPAAAMIASFARPAIGKSSLLTHNEVVTYFHEFGHVMHQLCSEATIKRFAGTAVERDFVEAPSQMLEHFCWEPSILRRLSCHYSTNEPLPWKLIDRLVASRTGIVGLANKRQLLYALFDLKVHDGGKVNTATILVELHKEVQLVPMSPKTNLAATFGHIAGGYDAQYYSYLWSEVYAMDMFATRFEAKGLLNPTTGLDYREKILAHGGSVDASEMLYDFLGRPPNDIAFLKSKGVL
ncbi:thimet oligopeptidase [Thraustotheca clavata]|uniref:Thimet oligopeptidase n=1 Tax=Thraustotheca clavata TaxID=74557 RepID=A0A1V9Z5T1_9STRA|nr:thimet oligopeptidase [Thraustotheca clavata]